MDYVQFKVCPVAGEGFLSSSYLEMSSNFNATGNWCWQEIFINLKFSQIFMVNCNVTIIKILFHVSVV